jgi:nucleotide-binding universal stress UspA family protein
MMSSKPYVVVVGTDFSEQASRALQTAYEHALKHVPAELHVVHASVVINPEAEATLPPFVGAGILPVTTLEEQQTELIRYLDEQLARRPGFATSGIRVVAHVLLDAPVFALSRLAHSVAADMIVVGSHGRHGVARWLLGSVAEAVVRQASCPVLVVPPLPHELPAPHIDPPCPDCVKAREAAVGARDLAPPQWCARHRERHGRRHVYHQGDRVGADTNLPLVVR